MKIKPRFVMAAAFLVIFSAQGRVAGDALFGETFQESSIKVKKITCELVFQIGSEKDEEAFYNPQDFALNERGEIFILDSGNTRIQHFSPKGKYLDSFGRSGQGPGDFSKIAYRIKILEDKKLYVIDNLNRKISVFAQDGKFLESHPTKTYYDDILLKDGVYYLTNALAVENHRPIHCSERLDSIEESFGDFLEPIKDFFKQKEEIQFMLAPLFGSSRWTGLSVNSGGELVFAQRHPYRIVVFGKDKRKRKEIHGEIGSDTHFPASMEMKNGRAVFTQPPPYSHIYNAQFLPDGRLMVPFLSLDRSVLYLDFYSPDFLLNSRFEMSLTFIKNTKNSGIKSLFLDGDGNLYSLVVSKEDIPRLFKHRLTFHK